ncbi:unnamed protein product [Sphagnum jensenii]|uniref:Protein kinase domain-containing protein n=1 Tax=Sphagnum jensenii TaxID=128206 RepID=A0ABP1B3K9_9BRYO
MDKCTGVSTAWLLMAVLGVLCNVSVPGVLAENPPGSFFLNCGSTASYVDKVTNIAWMPDDLFIDEKSGVNANVSSSSQYYPDFPELTTLRLFPDSRAKYCYSFPVTPNTTYRIRGTFFYGNYDNQNTVPKFQMAIEGTIVASNFISEVNVIAYQEISFVPQRNVTFLCLSRDITNSVPFISAISLVKSNPEAGFAENLYRGYYYLTKFRWNFGGNGIIRSPDDSADHYWFPIKSGSPYVQSTAQVEALTATNIVHAVFPPETVMDTALTTNGTCMIIDIPLPQSSIWFMTLYWSELNPNASASSRQFYVGVPGNETQFVNPFVNTSGLGEIFHLSYSGPVPNYVSLFKNLTTSTALGPLVNALEIFELSQNQFVTLTNEQDTLAIEEIKSSYGNLALWTGDPCLPYPHPWVTCSNVSIIQSSSSIIAVNLSRYGLTGPISPSFGKLRSLTSLNLRSNQLSGPIPPSIWDIPKLNVLDLSDNNLSGNLVPITSTSCPMSLTRVNLGNNNLSGSFPSQLLACSISTLQEINFDYNNLSGTLNMTSWDFDYNNLTGTLNMTSWDFDYNNLSGNSNMTSWDLEANNTFHISMLYNDINTLEPGWGDPIMNYFEIWLTGNPICKNLQCSSNFMICEIQQTCCCPQEPLYGQCPEFAKQQVQPTLYSYNMLSRATGDFHEDNKLGEGGFGVVYKGILLDGTKLAIKLLMTKSHQGIDDFLNEVVSITGVRHKNLVKLKGCCLHHTQRLLVYEFVENKNLAEALWGSNMEDNIFLNWPTRFQIFVGITRGLVYLHEDLQPRIIHRDIKASNILLDKNFNAKIADFGLARLFSDNQSQLFTQVAGTIGYMSPEYATLGQLSTKVDVYSFGVLLLEIISGRKAILQNATNNMYLVEWAWSLHKTNMLISLVDPKMQNTIVESEVQRVINVALLCVQVETTKHPTMSQVLGMLQGEMDLPNIIINSSENDISTLIKISQNVTSPFTTTCDL